MQHSGRSRSCSRCLEQGPSCGSTGNPDVEWKHCCLSTDKEHRKGITMVQPPGKGLVGARRWEQAGMCTHSHMHMWCTNAHYLYAPILLCVLMYLPFGHTLCLHRYICIFGSTPVEYCQMNDRLWCLHANFNITLLFQVGFINTKKKKKIP